MFSVSPDPGAESDRKIMNKLLDKIYGAIIGSAIGDAMGGPVEGLHFNDIAERYGRVETLLPYTEVTPSYHGPFTKDAGSYTDDTRISILFAKAAVHAGGLPKKGDLVHTLAEYYFNAETNMERGFIEEYYLKGIYGDEKEAFGGRPTNGGIMGIASLGALFPADPEAAFSHVFNTLFLSTGSARTASAFAAAMIGAAMVPETGWEKVMNDAFAACAGYKRSVEAGGWRSSNLYPVVAIKSEQMARIAMDMGAAVESVDDLRQDLYDALVQPFFADGSESLSLAVAMLCAARGDFSETIIGCVNFGRDNDSSAAIGGAVAGALCGASGIPSEWIDLINKANPDLSLYSLAEDLTGLVARQTRKTVRSSRTAESLLCSRETAGEPGISLPDLLELVESNGDLKEALKTGADPDQQNADGKTALHMVSANGDNSAIELLLLNGADVNLQDKNQTTALHFAAWKNNLKSVHTLLSRSADADLAEGKGWTAIHDAVRQEYMDIVCEILSFSRCLKDHSKVLEDIFKLSGDERFLAVLSLLHANQVELDSVGICGQGLLHDAVERGYRQSAGFLLSYGADVNQLALSFEDTRFEGTPLHKAAACGFPEIYKDLIAAGADTSILNIDGKTAEDLHKERRL